MFHDRELAHYNEAMEQSLADKLFFLDHLQAETYVDFGCANGALLKGIHAKQLNGWRGFGIDHSEFQLASASQKYPEGVYAAEFSLVRDMVLARTGKKVAIFSSVLHEAPELIQHALGWADYIVVRDMGVSEGFSRWAATDAIWQRVMAEQPAWDTFMRTATERHGIVDDLHEYMRGDLLAEFLLKVPYIDTPSTQRTQRELGEPYPMVGVEALLSNSGPVDGYGVTYFEHYSLPYIRDRIRRQFGFDFPYPTHFKLILQRV